MLKREDFFSSLKNKGITDEEWEEFKENRKGMKTIRDLLEFYNNLDVKPFLEAILNNRQFFYDLNIDMFKDGMSLPALAEKIMFSYEFQDFNNEFIKKEIPESKYELLTNWREKFKGYKEQDQEKDKYNKN